jgi:hypothetical protein
VPRLGNVVCASTGSEEQACGEPADEDRYADRREDPGGQQDNGEKIQVEHVEIVDLATGTK